MNVLIYFIIAMLYVILILWIWNNTKYLKSIMNEIMFIIIGIVSLIIVTFIIFNISNIGIDYENREILNKIREVSILIFVPINGFLSLPHIANIKEEIKLKNKTNTQIKSKVIFLGMIWIISLIFEVIYLKNFQNGIIQILNNK